MRRGGRQKVVVEHVHVYPGGQAIVGDVTHVGRGVSGENAQQAHATDDKRTVAFAPGAEMRCTDQEREAVPVAGGGGKRRCRMHGGAPGSGAPRGTATGIIATASTPPEAIAERRAVRALIRNLGG